MRIKNSVLLLGISVAMTLFFVAPSSMAAQPKPGTHAPMITSTFAVEKGYQGYIWKIYLEAEDPDGDMLRIASVAEQPGFAHPFTDWIFIKSPYQKHFKGYIQWNIGQGPQYLWPYTHITLNVSIQDKAGNWSNEVIFPFAFQEGIDSTDYRLPAPFDQGELAKIGNVFIDIYQNPQTGVRREH
jgi:hypothetical protein